MKMLIVLAVLSLVVMAVQGDTIIQMWGVNVPKQNPVIGVLEYGGHLDVWGGNSTHAQILVNSTLSSYVEQVLKLSQVSYWVEVEDMMSLVQQERHFMKEAKKGTRNNRAAHPMDWNVYHDMEDIKVFLEWLKGTGDGLVQVVTVAITAEGRQVPAVKLTDPNSPGPKKKIWMESGIHAREWISPAVSTYILNLLVTEESWADLLKVTEWYIVPVANPDGYQFTFTSESARLWRKNRRTNLDGRCKGVDLIRNLNLEWGFATSVNPCSQTYKGLMPFSEPETQGLHAMMKAVGDIDLFIALQGSGQSILYPMLTDNVPPANVKQLQSLAKMFVNAVSYSSRGEVSYDIGGSGPLYGLASEGNEDLVYGALEVSLSYTIDLPDKGRYGFQLPESNISSTLVETAAGIKCMVGYITSTGHCAFEHIN